MGEVRPRCDTGTDTHIVRIDPPPMSMSDQRRQQLHPDGGAIQPARASGGSGRPVRAGRHAGADLIHISPRDGRWLYYSSAAAGGSDLWRLELATGKLRSA